MGTLAGRVSGLLPGVPVGHGWLELAEPPAVEAGLRLTREHGLASLVLQPLLLFSAYHATSDVPDVAAAIDVAEPRVQVATGRPLGLDPRLIELAGDLVSAVDPEPADGHGLLVVSSGTSDPDALAQAHVAMRAVADRTGHSRVEHAPASMGDDDVARAVADLAADGASSVTVFSWSLLAGRLVSRAQRLAEEAGLDAGVPVRFAGRFGPDPVVAQVLADRFLEVASRVR